MAYSRVNAETHPSILNQVRTLHKLPPSKESQGPTQFSLIHSSLAPLDKGLALWQESMGDDTSRRLNTARVFLALVVVLKTSGSFKVCTLKVAFGAASYAALSGAFNNRGDSTKGSVYPLASRVTALAEGQLMDLTSAAGLITLSVIFVFSRNIGLTMLGFATCQHTLMRYGVVASPRADISFTKEALETSFAHLDGVGGWQEKPLSPRFVQGFMGYVRANPDCEITGAMMRVFAAIPEGVFVPTERLIKAAINRHLESTAVFEDETEDREDSAALSAFLGNEEGNTHRDLHRELSEATAGDITERINPTIVLDKQLFDSTKYSSKPRPTLMGLTGSQVAPIKKEDIHLGKLAAAVGLIAFRGLWHRNFDLTLWMVGPSFLYTVMAPLASGGILRDPTLRLDSDEGLYVATALAVAAFVCQGAERIVITPLSGFFLGNYLAHLLPLYLDNGDQLTSDIRTWTTRHLITAAKRLPADDPRLFKLVLPALKDKLTEHGNQIGARQLETILDSDQWISQDHRLTELSRLLDALATPNTDSIDCDRMIKLLAGNAEERDLTILDDRLREFAANQYSFYPNSQGRAPTRPAIDYDMLKGVRALLRALKREISTGERLDWTSCSYTPTILRLISKNGGVKSYLNRGFNQDRDKAALAIVKAVTYSKQPLDGELAKKLMGEVLSANNDNDKLLKQGLKKILLKHFETLTHEHVAQLLALTFKTDRWEIVSGVKEIYSELAPELAKELMHTALTASLKYCNYQPGNQFKDALVTRIVEDLAALSDEQLKPLVVLCEQRPKEATFSFQNKVDLFTQFDTIKLCRRFDSSTKTLLTKALKGLRQSLHGYRDNWQLSNFEKSNDYYERFISIPNSFKIKTQSGGLQYFEKVIWADEHPLRHLASHIETIDRGLASLNDLDDSSSSFPLTGEIEAAITLLQAVDEVNPATIWTPLRYRW